MKTITDKREALEVVRKNGFDLECVSKELRADREVVLAAIKQEGNALARASEEIKLRILQVLHNKWNSANTIILKCRSSISHLYFS